MNREWKEGVLSSAVTSVGNSAIWIIFNGDVEPEWAEALNSALDDNRLLTLPNGIGVKLGSGTRYKYYSLNTSIMTFVSYSDEIPNQISF